MGHVPHQALARRRESRALRSVCEALHVATNCQEPDAMICVSIGRGRHKHDDGRASASGRTGRRTGRVAAGLHRARRQSEAAAGRSPLPGHRHLPPRRRTAGKWDGQRGGTADAAAQPRSPRASSTSIWRRTSPATIPRFGKTKRIVSFHNFRETPDNLDEIHAAWPAWTPTSSRSPRWPTTRTTTCGCCS